MTEARIIFEMLGYWHMGTGSGKGFDYDAVVSKTAKKLPYIPGRTVKGLLREAVLLLEEAGRVASGTTADLFGRADVDSRYDSAEGRIAFSSATLHPDPSAEPGWNNSLPDYLYAGIASTRIDERGQAVDQSLRRIEVAIPAVLTASASCDDLSTTWVEVLKGAAPLVRMAGSHRHRGLGRVKVTVEGVDSGVTP